uniref:Uncharacterized protein n=1 Tax=Rhipicephalus microplus TaxID=6941 RepID=A0A6G5AIF3_RHIMP
MDVFPRRSTMRLVVSMNLLTQFWIQFSVFESILPPGFSTHTSQHFSVSSCTRYWYRCFWVSPSIKLFSSSSEFMITSMTPQKFTAARTILGRKCEMHHSFSNRQSF